MMRTRWTTATIAFILGCGLLFSMATTVASPLPQASPAQKSPPANTQPQTASPPTTPHQHQPPNTTGVLGKPPVEFRPDILDLGTIRPGQRATGIVYLQNISDKWLEVDAIKPDCSCTAATVSSHTIAPGQAVTLEVQYHANTKMGEWNGLVRVMFKGYDEIEVPTKAMVALMVRADPPYISAVPDNETRVRLLSGEYDVYSADEKPFRILAVNGEPPEFVGFDPQSDQPRNYYRLKWDFTNVNPRTCRDHTGKRMPGWVTVETDHPGCAIFDLEVRHECNMRAVPKRSDTWLIQEKRVLVGEMKTGAPAEFEVVAKWIPNAPHDPVKTVVSDTSQLTAELVAVESVDDGFVCKVRITPAASHIGLVYGVVRLHSNSQNHPITVIGVVK